MVHSSHREHSIQLSVILCVCMCVPRRMRFDVSIELVCVVQHWRAHIVLLGGLGGLCGLCGFGEPGCTFWRCNVFSGEPSGSQKTLSGERSGSIWIVKYWIISRNIEKKYVSTILKMLKHSPYLRRSDQLTMTIISWY